MAQLRKHPRRWSTWQDRRFARDQWRYWAARALEAERELEALRQEDREEHMTGMLIAEAS